MSSEISFHGSIATFLEHDSFSLALIIFSFSGPLPINIRFNELFKVEKLTILGKISDAFKKKLQPMNPIIKSYVGGIN